MVLNVSHTIQTVLLNHWSPDKSFTVLKNEYMFLFPVFQELSVLSIFCVYVCLWMAVILFSYI